MDLTLTLKVQKFHFPKSIVERNWLGIKMINQMNEMVTNKNVMQCIGICA